MNNSPSHYAPNDAALEESKLKALEQSISRLEADHAERSAQRRARYAEDARIQDRFRDLVFGHLRSKDVELKQLAEDRRRLIEGRPKLVRRPSMEGLSLRRSPDDAVKPLSFARVPPYDFTWGGASASTGGDITLSVQSLGNGERSVGGGIGFWFSDAAGNPGARFSTSVNFSYDWSEGAAAYAAHNHGRTWLTVWGMSENGWVATGSDQTPSWADSVGWYDSHHDSRGGSTSQEVFFNAKPNSLYACWVNASATVYADGGFLGFADSTIHMHIALVAVYVQ